MILWNRLCWLEMVEGANKLNKNLIQDNSSRGDACKYLVHCTLICFFVFLTKMKHTYTHTHMHACMQCTHMQSPSLCIPQVGERSRKVAMKQKLLPSSKSTIKRANTLHNSPPYSEKRHETKCLSIYFILMELFLVCFCCDCREHCWVLKELSVNWKVSVFAFKSGDKAHVW